jgi:hypothetical protein
MCTFALADAIKACSQRFCNLTLQQIILKEPATTKISLTLNEVEQI